MIYCVVFILAEFLKIYCCHLLLYLVKFFGGARLNIFYSIS